MSSEDGLSGVSSIHRVLVGCLGPGNRPPPPPPPARSEHEPLDSGQAGSSGHSSGHSRSGATDTATAMPASRGEGHWQRMASAQGQCAEPEHGHGHEHEHEHEDEAAEARTPIQEFFRGSTVLLTGATGFMGKVLLQKLLRACPDLRLVHLLVRSKKGRDVQARFEEIFEDPLFDTMKREVPKWRHKVSVVAGDCSQPHLALSAADRATLVRDVDVLFHGAATVRFDETLKVSTAINVSGTQQIFALAREMAKLKAMAHVSTAYSHCILPEIGERFYDTPFPIDKLLELTGSLGDAELEKLTPGILGNYPNTYVFTKAMAEEIVKKECHGLPLVVFRPAIVVGTRSDPVAGWIDNVYGPTGVTVGAGVGLLKVLNCDSNALANIVPVDMAVNALIAATWDVACNPVNNNNIINNNNNNNNNNNIIKHKSKEQAGARPVPIYNYVSSCEQPLRWGEFMERTERNGMIIPTMRSVWYYSFRLTKSRPLYLLQVLLLHFLPALLLDGALLLVRAKPRLLKAYKKVHRFSDVIAYFSTRAWSFSNDNVVALWNRVSEDDRKIFDFDMKGLDWEDFLRTYVHGCRLYILKDDFSTLPQARVRWRRFYWAHQALKLILSLLALKLIMPVLSYGVGFIFT